MVELALVLPLFLLLVYGIISFGSVYLVSQSLKNAASDGARVALAGSTQVSEANLACTQVTQDLGSYIPGTPSVTYAFSAPGSSAQPGVACGQPPPSPNPCTTPCLLTVTVIDPYSSHPLVPASGLFPFVPDTISGTTTIEVNS